MKSLMVLCAALCFVPSVAKAQAIRVYARADVNRVAVSYDAHPLETVIVNLPTDVIKANWSCQRTPLSFADDKYTVGFICSNGKKVSQAFASCSPTKSESRSSSLVLAGEKSTVVLTASCVSD
jgi:hypothetical protein